MTLQVWIPGNPKTKGSMVQQGKRMVQSVEGSDDWALKITRAVQQVLAIHPTPYVGAVMVSLAFWLSVADATEDKCGDVDKLLRNVLDALTKAGAYGDDVQVTHATAFKYPVGAGGVQQAGVLVTVQPIDPLAGVEYQAMAVHAQRRLMGLTT